MFYGSVCGTVPICYFVFQSFGGPLGERSTCFCLRKMSNVMALKHTASRKLAGWALALSLALPICIALLFFFGVGSSHYALLHCQIRYLTESNPYTSLTTWIALELVRTDKIFSGNELNTEPLRIFVFTCTLIHASFLSCDWHRWSHLYLAFPYVTWSCPLRRRSGD